MDIVDLDALSPQSAIIRYDNQDIEIPPPKTGDIIRLGTLAGKLGESDKMSDDELNRAVEDLTQQIYKIIPDLKDKLLNLAQIQKLVSIISDMATPPESLELKERGITVDSPKV